MVREVRRAARISLEKCMGSVPFSLQRTVKRSQVRPYLVPDTWLWGETGRVV